MTAIERVEGIDKAAILAYLNLRPNEVATQALLLICDRYGLDPLMKHMVLISGKPYVTRDGYMHIAHSTGQLDGIEIVGEGEDEREWWAKVAVWRKDMTHPFTYRGRYPKDGQQKKYGPEMAIKTAEVMALRRAFDVTGVGAADEQWDEHIEPAPPSPRLLALIESIDALDDPQALRDAIAEKVWNGEDVPLEDLPEGWWPTIERWVAEANGTVELGGPGAGPGLEDRDGEVEGVRAAVDAAPSPSRTKRAEQVLSDAGLTKKSAAEIAAAHSHVGVDEKTKAAGA